MYGMQMVYIFKVLTIGVSEEQDEIA